MPLIEIRVRTFYSGDEADAVPSTTVTIERDEIDKVPWPQTVRALVKQIDSQLDGAPITNLHEMSSSQAEAYRDAERQSQ